MYFCHHQPILNLLVKQVYNSQDETGADSEPATPTSTTSSSEGTSRTLQTQASRDGKSMMEKWIKQGMFDPDPEPEVQTKKSKKKASKNSKKKK